MSEKKDTIFRTFLVAFLTCAICSVFVAGAAVVLRPIQQKNQELFKNKNILLACGLMERGEKVSAEEVGKRLADVRVLKVNLATGDIAAEGEEAKKYDERTAAKTSGESVEVSDPVGLSSRGKFGTVYVATKDGKVSRIVFPIVGKGLWSVMYGFIALGSDGNTIDSLIFYEHGETAGLGGEIENPNWQKVWVGKKAFKGDVPGVRVVKGVGQDEYSVDGISGATLTGNGVTRTTAYWLKQYQPFLKKFMEEGENAK